MSPAAPVAELDARFSDPSASALEWARARAVLDEAGIAWIVTTRRDGRPHVTPVVFVWFDDAAHFCTGTGEQKHKNLDANPSCLLLTGRNTYDEGLDVVVEGEAVRVADGAAPAAGRGGVPRQVRRGLAVRGPRRPLPPRRRPGDRLQDRLLQGARLRSGYGRPDPLAARTARRAGKSQGPRAVQTQFAVVRDLAADVVIDHRWEGWPDQVRDAVGGVDVVLDGVGGELARERVRAAGTGWSVGGSFGAASGSFAAIDDVDAVPSPGHGRTSGPPGPRAHADWRPRSRSARPPPAVCVR